MATLCLELHKTPNEVLDMSESQWEAIIKELNRRNDHG